MIVLVTASLVALAVRASNFGFAAEFERMYDSTHFDDAWTPEEGVDYCYALALSGGGSYGTYETGVVWGLLHYGNPDLYRWDVFTGVSAGSINAGMYAVWPKGKEVEMSENVSYMCTVTGPSSTMQMWPGVLPGPVDGLLYHKGLFDESPFTDYMNDYFGNFTEIPKKLVVSAVDVESGIYTPFDESVGVADLGTVIRASTSIPFVFEPTEYQGRWYMDGGTVWNINLKSAVDKCMDMGYPEEHIVVDAAITEFLSLDELTSTGKSYDNFWRQREIRKYYKTMNDVAEFARSRPHVNYRHFFKPSEKLGGSLTEVDFRNSTTWHFQEVGRADAQAALDSAAENAEQAPLHSFARVMADHHAHVRDTFERNQFFDQQ